jgi:hypothetical protein
VEGTVSEHSGSAPAAASPALPSVTDEPCPVPRGEQLLEASRLGSGIGTVYEALDRLVALYALDDAVLVVDVPGLGRQVLHAGRKPLGNDERGLLRSPPGLYLDPPLHDRALDDLMLAIGALGLRFDARAGACA